MITERGDIHHIFPKEYLKRNKYNRRNKYNQIANYVYMQTEINIKIGSKSPNVYFKDVLEQCNGGKLKYGSISDKSQLLDNLKMNCVPEGIIDMDVDNYEEFLTARRKLIAQKIKEYYFSL